MSDQLDAIEVPTLSVLMTSFNRRDFTLECLRRLQAQDGTEPRKLTVFLVDDHSSDGTVAAVKNEFPDVHVQVGDGNLFWVRGMRMAFSAAMEIGFDYYLWLNDDTMLVHGAIDSLLRTSKERRDKGIVAIIAASISSHGETERSYGGFIQQRGIASNRLIPIDPLPDIPLVCDTMNGNCVLIPHEIACRLENLEGRFHHCFADLDYGLRAKQAGYPVYLASGFLANCNDNSMLGTWRDASIPFRKRWKHLTSPKGCPFPEWSLFCRRHLGLVWPLYAISPYVKTVVTSIWSGWTRRESKRGVA